MRSNASFKLWLPVVNAEPQVERRSPVETWAWERRFDRRFKPVIESSCQTMVKMTIYQTMVVWLWSRDMTTTMNPSPPLGDEFKNGMGQSC